MAQTSPRSLLQYVQQQLGRREVAKRLRVTEDTIVAWLDDPAEMPNGKRLVLADLVQELTHPGPKR